jgi:hypothetical protein
VQRQGVCKSNIVVVEKNIIFLGKTVVTQPHFYIDYG